MLSQFYVSNVAGGDCSYNRIIATRGMYEQFTGDGGVLRFDEVFELDCDTKAVSDHYPVYGVFRMNRAFQDGLLPPTVP